MTASALPRSGAGTLRKDRAGDRVRLAGWVNARRDHGGVVFVDLRDRTGLCQVVFDPARSGKETFALAERLRAEAVVGVAGILRERTPETVNPNLPTGEVEVEADELEIYAVSEPLPFPLDAENVGEEVRLMHRYLDLRRPKMAEAMRARAEVVRAARAALEAEGFLEFETPILTRPTPEGARDYLVPSRTQPGSVFALPQSPQLFKQILMVAGFERYYQIARCFRDEDLRADRQPEFTQIDVEMSFADEAEVQRVSERVIAACFEAVGRTFPSDVPRLSYDEALLRYGSDRPDLAIPLEIADVTDLVRDCGFDVFRKAVETGGVVRALPVPGGGDLSRREIDELTDFAKKHGAKGLAYFFARNGTLESNVAKFFEKGLLAALRERLALRDGDWVCFAADAAPAAARVLGALREEIADRRNLREGGDRLVWIVDFPLLEYDVKEKRWFSCHHPFTAPAVPGDVSSVLAALDGPPEKLRARAYDLVWNGTELGGGSIRIHRPDVQRKVFALLGISPEEAEAKFGFLLRALSFGAPPHGGIAFGLDRLVARLLGRDSIRDVIAFPKTQAAVCPMTGSPSPASPAQWAELHLRPLGEGVEASSRA